MGHPSFTGVCFWAYSGGLGFALVRAKCRGGSAAWVARVLAAPGTQSWQLGQQSSKRVWQPVLANMLQYSYLENPNREAYQATVYRVTKSWICMKWSCLHRCKTFFFFWPVAALPQWELSVKVAQLAGTLAAPSMWRHGLPPLQEVWPSQSLFQASCSWCSEGLFGQPLSVALPTQALRGSPCLQSVSVVGHVRHTEGWGGVLGSYIFFVHLVNISTWVGSYSVVQWLRRLMGQPLYCSAAEAGMWGNREAMVMALLSWLPGFSPQAFPTIIFLFTSPRSVSL